MKTKKKSFRWSLWSGPAWKDLAETFPAQTVQSRILSEWNCEVCWLHCQVMLMSHPVLPGNSRQATWARIHCSSQAKVPTHTHNFPALRSPTPLPAWQRLRPARPATLTDAQQSQGIERHSPPRLKLSLRSWRSSGGSLCHCGVLGSSPSPLTGWSASARVNRR